MLEKVATFWIPGMLEIESLLYYEQHPVKVYLQHLDLMDAHSFKAQRETALEMQGHNITKPNKKK